MSFIQTDTYAIRGYECDAFGRLSSTALMNFMQESANRNAIDYGIGISDLARHGYGWMLMRFRLRIHQYPRYGQTIRVVTYPTFVEKYFIYRDFQVLGDDDTLLADASSVWLVFDTTKRSMVALPAFIRALHVPTGIEPMPKLNLKPDIQLDLSAVHETKDIAVGWTSIDQNQHVNNVAYVGWLLESINRNRLETLELAEIDLVYRTETHWGDQLLVLSQASSGATLSHRIEHPLSGKEVLVAQSQWRATSNVSAAT
ncbi:thioesterase [Spirosoma terrae]|uniref:Acyl-[acyl-carrier-protein] thioesterase n=1 Tax=Spirosoma terrae TaxID=1968276 RepID=A0A6L9LJ00_9BACT|nr:acyl-ACP thioesterase domain-containing protein [Spirosoma terrae]NDU98903.1 acyl-[acyl-carrier-protein] thioesterase [Spirosoma terrae]